MGRWYHLSYKVGILSGFYRIMASIITIIGYTVMLIKKIALVGLLSLCGNAYSAGWTVPEFSANKWVKVLGFVQEPAINTDGWASKPSSLEVYASSDVRDTQVWAIQTRDYGSGILPKQSVEKYVVPVTRVNYLRMLDLVSRGSDNWSRFVTEGKLTCATPRKHIFFKGKSQTILGYCDGVAEAVPAISDHMKALSIRLEKLLTKVANEGVFVD